MSIFTPTLATEGEAAWSTAVRGGKLVAFTPFVVELKPGQKLFPLDMLEWVQWFLFLKGKEGLEGLEDGGQWETGSSCSSVNGDVPPIHWDMSCQIIITHSRYTFGKWFRKVC